MNLNNLEISKTHGGYYKIYKLRDGLAIPYSPFEFINKKDAKDWLEMNWIKEV